MDINEIRKYNPEGSNLRKAQHRMLEMLIAFDKLCQENKLDYWLDGGTLLGAVRHGGFIPWDDDTDVGMTRKSAEKLKEILKNKKLEDRFVLQHVDNEKFYIKYLMVYPERYL